MKPIDRERLLEWLIARRKVSESNGWGSYVGYNESIKAIESGAFDVEEPKDGTYRCPKCGDKIEVSTPMDHTITELSKEELQKIQQQNVQDALDVLKEKGLNWEAEILASTIEAQTKELELLQTFADGGKKANRSLLNQLKEQNERLEKRMKDYEHKALRNINKAEDLEQENEQLRKELQGIGVEDYYTLQRKCQELGGRFRKAEEAVKEARRLMDWPHSSGHVRMILDDALSHIQGKENTDVHDPQG